METLDLETLNLLNDLVKETKSHTNSKALNFDFGDLKDDWTACTQDDLTEELGEF